MSYDFRVREGREDGREMIMAFRIPTPLDDLVFL